MGVTKILTKAGNGVDKPSRGDKITLLYDGFLYDPDNPSNAYRGKKFDSTDTRGDFITHIGIGQVIRGLDEGILSTDGGMSLGEKASLTITSDYAYGKNGFPGFIPPNTDLVFDIELKAINPKNK